MTKLADTQSIILSAAAKRPDGNLLPLPGSLRGGVATKVVAALLARGLAADHIIASPRQADPGTNTIWRNEDDGRAVMLIITAAGAEAIGIEPATEPCASDTSSAGEPGPGAPTSADEAPVEAAPKRRKTAPTGADVARARQTRGGTKQAQLIAMLCRKEGATIPEIVDALGWQPHKVRGAFAGALKKKRGLTVTSQKVDGIRVYRLP
jgi:hypothetical protein